MTRAPAPQRIRSLALHALRLALFVSVLVLMRWKHAQISAQSRRETSAALTVDRLRSVYPTAATADASRRDAGRTQVHDAAGQALGYALQTSPASDHVIGFSGPTNALIAFSPDNRIVGVDILSSGDTREHVQQVLQDEAFLSSFRGLSWEQASQLVQVDGVSGATLTSLAIKESIIFRLSGGRPSLRFPEPLKVADVRGLFASAAAVRQTSAASLWHVLDQSGEQLGAILRTAPFADNIIGFQGPTETLIGFEPGGRVSGIAIKESYDNEPYVSYVREDQYFTTLFNDLKLAELAALDLDEAQVEGVSGATMTSMAVAEGMIQAAGQHLKSLPESTGPSPHRLAVSGRDLGTALVIITGLVIALTPLRGRPRVRVGFQLLLIGYLGLINGDMVSQAMIVGWAQNRVPWQSAGGLVMLTAAALLVPLTTRRNAYCTHLCPHGAAQQLLKNRLGWRLRLPRRFERTAKRIPALLLLWCVLVAMASLPFSLVDIEPFDAWVLGVAGWATVSIAVMGLIASLFVPLAYCRYGCPTGALLNYLRFNSRSDRWSRRDWWATLLVMVALALFVSG